MGGKILRPFRAWGQEGDLYLRLHRRLFIFSHINDCSVKPLAGLGILTNKDSCQILEGCRNEDSLSNNLIMHQRRCV
jgi:hypothetical protein